MYAVKSIKLNKSINEFIMDLKKIDPNLKITETTDKFIIEINLNGNI